MRPSFHTSRIRENWSSEFSTRSDTNRPVQSQKMARSLNIRIYEEEGLYYPKSKNKGTDQLCSYCKADLHLCFHIGKIPVFSWHGSHDRWPVREIFWQRGVFSLGGPLGRGVKSAVS